MSEKVMHCSADDPKWTAYVLDELGPAERASVERELANSAEAREVVDGIRSTVGLLTASLKTDTSQGLTEEQRERIRKATSNRPRGRLRPAFALALAACVVIGGMATLAFYRSRNRQVAFTSVSNSISAGPAQRSNKQKVEIVGPSATAETGGIVGAPNSGIALKGRGRGTRGRLLRTYGGTRGTEQAVEPLNDPAPGAPYPNFTADLEVPFRQDSFSLEEQQNSNRLTGLGTAARTHHDSYKRLPQSPSLYYQHDIKSSAPDIEFRYARGAAEKSRLQFGGDDRSTGFNTEGYDQIVENPFLGVRENPLSTFSIDVDTASYSNVRRFLLTERQLPPKSAVRIEELLNYFSYDYPQPSEGVPFSTTVEVAGCPWNAQHRLVRVGLKGREIERDRRPPSNLVFLLDVSGSMNEPNKLPLVKQSMKLLAEQLQENDRVAIVVYAGSSGLVLPSTPASNRQEILYAIDRLEAGGSTNGAQGIELAYQTAIANLIKGGTNRVILATDGDFNVGITDRTALIELVQQKAAQGVFLTTLGFGMGNLKDGTLEQLADKGNGTYGYIDDMREAKKLFVEGLAGTLVTIAKDVKIQIEFNPARVESYRLVGYENRALRAEDFNDDKKDAGEIGAGRTVTAIYELVPSGSSEAKRAVDPLKYQQPAKVDANASSELLTLKLRYKDPDGDKSKLIEHSVKDEGRSYAQASGDFKFAASVALFGMILRDSEHKGTATLDAALELAREGLGKDQQGYRAEFVQLIQRAKELKP